MKRWLMRVCVAVFVVSAVLAQEKKAVPPPPKPADEGPSLEVTMKFIQDKLNGIGPVNFVAYLHDDIKGSDAAPNPSKDEAVNVVADSRGCRMSYHYKMERSGYALPNPDREFLFRDVGEVVVMPNERQAKESATAAGHPEYTSRFDPPVFALVLRRTNTKEESVFRLFDEEMANRVAKAMVHAVELCGGGAKSEPF